MTRNENGGSILSILAGAAAVLAAAALIVVLVLGVPPVLHLPVSVVFLCACAAFAARARRRQRRRLALVLASASVIPLVFSQWSTRVLGSFLLADLSLPLYVAIAGTIVALVLSAAARLTRAPLFAPAAIIASAVALFGIGVALFPAAALESQLWAGAILVAYGAATWPWLIGSLAARITARSLTAVASIAALLLAAATWPSVVWGTAASFLLTAGVFALSLFFSPVAVSTEPPADTRPLRVVLPTREPALLRELGAWKTAAAVGLGLALAGIAAAPAVHVPTLALQLDVTGVLTALLSSALAVGSWRIRHQRSAPGLRIAGLVTLAVCTITVVPSLGITTIEMWNRVAVANFSIGAGAPHPLIYPEVSPSSWVGAAALTAATTVTLVYAGMLRRFSWLPLGLGALTVLMLVASAANAALAAGLASALAVAATTLFIVLRPRRGRRILLTLVTIIAAALAFLLGANSAALWPVTAAITLASLIALRVALPRRVARADRLAVGPVITGIVVFLALVTSRWIPMWLAGAADAVGASSALAMVVTASIMLIASAALSETWLASDASVTSVIAALVAVIGIGGLADAAGADGQTRFVIGLACVLVAQLSWQLLPGARHSTARYVTAVLTPPTAVLLAVVAWRQFGPSIWGAPELLAVSIAVCLAWLGILVFRGPRVNGTRTRPHTARLAWDSSIALTSIITVPAALTTSDFGGLHLLLLGVLPILFSLGEGSISHGTGSRRHLVWASIPPLGAGIWVTVMGGGQERTALAALSVALLVIAALAIVASRRPRPSAPTPPGRNMLALAALAIFLIPSIVIGITGTAAQTTLVLLIAAVLCTIGAFLPPLIRGIHAALWLWGSGAVTAIVITSIHAYSLVARRPFALSELLDWGAVGTVFAAVFGVLWLRRGHPQPRLAVGIIAIAPLLLALPFANVAAIFAVPGWLLALVAAGISAFFSFSLGNPTKSRELIIWTTSAAAGFLAVGTITGAHTAVEFVSAPVGVVTIAVNLRLFARERTTGSWRTLGPALGALVAPSLLQCLTDPAPFRIAWLVVCIAAIAAFGVRTRLQAPLVVAAGAALVLLLTFVWPVAVSVLPWGTVLLALVILAALTALVVVRSSLPFARALRSIARMR